MPKNDNNKTARLAHLKALQAGLTKYFGSTTLVLLGTSYTPASLQAFLQADIDAINGSTSARASWLTAVKVESDTDAKTDPVTRAIAAQVKAQYGESQNAGAILADFDLSPRKVVILTAEQTAAKAAKLRATREARNTMGSRQKAKVKGVVPSATVPDATASASSPAGGSSGTTANGSNAPASPASPVLNVSTVTSHT